MYNSFPERGGSRSAGAGFFGLQSEKVRTLIKSGKKEELMQLRSRRRSVENAFICPVCGKMPKNIGKNIGVCPDCIRNRWEESQDFIEAVHFASRKMFRLPPVPPKSEDGLPCYLCSHQCRMNENEQGYCGVRRGTRDSIRRDGRFSAKVSYYYDLLPTNCVADWVCPGGTGAGYPRYANDRGPEAGFYNLAVFFEACNFNCLYCQNWSFKETKGLGREPVSIGELAGAVNKRTSCICFFGGDPTPQLPYAIRVSEQARREHPDSILRICWETNGAMHPAWLKRMARLSLESGGCIKMDLKAWHPHIHKALCGFGNRQVLENFSRLAQWIPLRPDPPLLVASTLMVPGYVNEEEIFHIASFIARLNPDIPYVLLAFAPQFMLEDFPTTSRAQGNACLDAAGRAGLRRVRLGNAHLLC